MRLSLFSFGIFALIATVLASSWSKEDQEIFRVRSELEAAEGPDVSFYEFMGVKAGASIEEIKQAYKKKSRLIHPDKVKQKLTGKSGAKLSKKQIKAAKDAASDRFTRLGLVNRILQDERRDRYDHFLSNGFPKWRDTGYYYERFRPGLGSVLIGLFVFGGGFIHWILKVSTWKRDQEFMQRYISRARREAWGDNLGISSSIGSGTATPPVAAADDGEPGQALNRRQRRMQEKDTKKDKSDKKTKGSTVAKGTPAGTPPIGAVGPKKRVVAENGKILIVDQVGNVYLEGEDENGAKQEYLLDPNEFPKPTIRDTALFKLPIWAYNSSVGRFLNKASAAEEVDAEAEDAEATSNSSGADDYEVLEKVKTTAENGNGKSIKRKKSGRK